MKHAQVGFAVENGTARELVTVAPNLIRKTELRKAFGVPMDDGLVLAGEKV